jgi:hypothetical protein
MRPALSPFLSAAISAAFVLAALTTSARAQQSTTVTEQTVTERTVTRSSAQPKEIVTTEIEFQPAATANDINVQMLRDFENVKQGDRKVASDIARSPEVVENASYVAKHPALQAFLEKYPDVRAEIVENPGNFVTPVAGSKWASREAAGIPRD